MTAPTTGFNNQAPSTQPQDTDPEKKKRVAEMLRRWQNPDDDDELALERTREPKREKETPKTENDPPIETFSVLSTSEREKEEERLRQERIAQMARQSRQNSHGRER